MCWEQHWGCAYKSEFPPDPCAVIDIHFISAYIMNLLILGCFHLNCMLSLKQIKMKEIFFGNTGVWIQGFQIARQVSYLLSHLQPLCSGYFQDRVLLFAWAGLDMILLFILDGRHIPPCPAVFCFAIEMGFLDLFFCPGWHGNYDLNLSILWSWVAGTCYCVQLLVEMGSCKLFTQGWPWTAILLFCTSRVARITGVGLWCLAR
jgi:hypothetical protein